MKNLIITEGYASKLSVRETQRAIKAVKDTFEKKLSAALNLERITAPLFVKKHSGVNDDLNGVERSVSFDIKELHGVHAEIVQSLAKWKRMALYKYGYGVGEGIYTDMNAIRRDDSMDNIHSVFVDQWDWELVIDNTQRNFVFLKSIVRKIAGALADTAEIIKQAFPALSLQVERDVFFITSQELEDRYPALSPKEREKEITRIYKTVFIMQIGDLLKSGIKHDGRAPDYDDWALNGDLLVWNGVLNEQLELSSMGIRVNAESLLSQLKKSGNEDRLQFSYHKGIAEGTLPLTIGGGIGQSRLCMFMLEKLHIGEVQVSMWQDEMLAECKSKGIHIL